MVTITMEAKKNVNVKNKIDHYSNTCSTNMQNTLCTSMINKLPVDVMKDIFRHLPFEEIVKNMALVCKLFRDASNHELLWQHIYQEAYPSAPLKAGDPWKQLFLCRKIEEKRQQYSKLPLDLAEQFILMESAFEMLKEQKKFQDVPQFSFEVNDPILTSPSSSSEVSLGLGNFYNGSVFSDETVRTADSSLQRSSNSLKCFNSSATIKLDNFLRTKEMTLDAKFAEKPVVSSITSEAQSLLRQKPCGERKILENIMKEKNEQMKQQDISFYKDLDSNVVALSEDGIDSLQNYDTNNMKFSNSCFFPHIVTSMTSKLHNTFMVNEQLRNSLEKTCASNGKSSFCAMPPCSLLSGDSSYPNDVCVTSSLSRSGEQQTATQGEENKAEEKQSLSVSSPLVQNHSSGNNLLGSVRRNIMSKANLSNNKTPEAITSTLNQLNLLSSSSSPFAYKSSSLHLSSDVVSYTTSRPTVESTIAEWKENHPEIFLLSFTEENVSHICSGQRCTFTVSPALNLYICNDTGKHHICGGRSSCDRAFPSDQDLGFLVCPVTGRIFDCLSSISIKNEKSYGAEGGVDMCLANLNKSSFESETREYMNLFMAEKQQEENYREEAAATDEGDDGDLTWSFSGFFGHCWETGYNRAVFHEYLVGCKKKRRKRR